MKFPRRASIFRGRPDAAPWASVFFLLLIFVLLGSLIYTPGVRLQLPVADDLPGTDQPTISVAVDAAGRLYFANQMISEPELRIRLTRAVKNSRERLTLVLQADKSVTYDTLIRLTLLARDAGIANALLATLPRVIATPTPGGKKP